MDRHGQFWTSDVNIQLGNMFRFEACLRQYLAEARKCCEELTTSSSRQISWVFARHDQMQGDFSFIIDWE
jgi:hypothetical protein